MIHLVIQTVAHVVSVIQADDLDQARFYEPQTRVLSSWSSKPLAEAAAQKASAKRVVSHYVGSHSEYGNDDIYLLIHPDDAIPWLSHLSWGRYTSWKKQAPTVRFVHKRVGTEEFVFLPINDNEQFELVELEASDFGL